MRREKKIILKTLAIMVNSVTYIKLRFTIKIYKTHACMQYMGTTMSGGGSYKTST